MDNEFLKNKIIADINKLKFGLKYKQIKILKIDRIENMINKLYQYSGACKECNSYLNTCNSYLMNNLNIFVSNFKNNNSLDKVSYRNYTNCFNKIVSHLCKKHKLSEKGTYFSIVFSVVMSIMSSGVSVGASISMCIGSSVKWMLICLGTGMGIGASMGILVGRLMYLNAKKKGNIV